MTDLCLFCQYSKAVENAWFCSREHEQLYDKLYKARMQNIVLENGAISRKERGLIDEMLKGAKKFAEDARARVSTYTDVPPEENQSWSAKP